MPIVTRKNFENPKNFPKEKESSIESKKQAKICQLKEIKAANWGCRKKDILIF